MKKRKDILESLMGIWTGICFDGWFISAIEDKTFIGTMFCIAWIAVPVMIFLIWILICKIVFTRKKKKKQ